MPRSFHRLTYTDPVRAAQEANGSRAAADRMASADFDDSRLGPAERDFIAARDSFYMATVTADGWPYVQHRGGPTGFLRALDDRTLGFADFRGNRQYLSVGNLGANDRTALFLMDYPNRRRLKVLARGELVAAVDRPDLVEQLTDPAYPGRPERAMLLHVAAFDWNCPQHITPRFTMAEIEGLQLG